MKMSKMDDRNCPTFPPKTEEDEIREYLKRWKVDSAETGGLPSTTPAEYIALKPLQDAFMTLLGRW
jgi:hypothetical protein